MAVDCEGRVVVTLEDGQVLCFERAPQVDINGDGEVNLEDLAVMANQWRQAPTAFSADIGPTPSGDGVVDFQDLAILTEYWLTYPGTVAHWKLDETKGDIAPDSAGQCNGMLNGDPQWQPLGGQLAGALKLDGIDDHVETDFVLSPVDGEFSIFAWVKGGSPGQVIVAQKEGVNWLSTDSLGGNLKTGLMAPGRGGKPLMSQTIITDGNWHRIGFGWDGSSRMLYVDGIAVAEDNQANLQDSIGGLYIGCGTAMAPGTYWSGLIDDVRIYNRVVIP
jgi:hypothetical protein